MNVDRYIIYNRLISFFLLKELAFLYSGVLTPLTLLNSLITDSA